jgi:anaerobic dimethyl sulfoxide reductase subunit B (iron-sulfur subunit)
MSKCNRCFQRVENGMEPACVHTCTTRALGFGTMEELSRKKAGKASIRILEGLLAGSSDIF